MILKGDDEFEWGIFPGKFDIRLLLEFWEYLQQRFAQLRVFDLRDLCLYSVSLFNSLHRKHVHPVFSFRHETIGLRRHQA